MVYVFTIVGKSEPLFEAELIPPSSGSQPAATTDELAYLHQFVLHASLDMVQSSMWSNNSNFLRVIDRFNTLLVSAYITPGGVTTTTTTATTLHDYHILPPLLLLTTTLSLLLPPPQHLLSSLHNYQAPLCYCFIMDEPTRNRFVHSL